MSICKPIDIKKDKLIEMSDRTVRENFWQHFESLAFFGYCAVLQKTEGSKWDKTIWKETKKQFCRSIITHIQKEKKKIARSMTVISVVPSELGKILLLLDCLNNIV